MKEYRTLAIGVAVVMVAVIAAFTLYIREVRHQEELREPGRRSLDLEATLLEEQGGGSREVELFFHRPGAGAPGPGLLVSERRSVFESADRSLVARQIVNELIRGPQGSGRAVFPPQARLRQVYILDGGTAVVDLSIETSSHLQGGILGEMALLQAVTRSLIHNIPEVSRVKFLVDGQETPSFAGHVSIREPFM